MNNLKPDFSKYSDRLMPAIIQDFISGRVLMLGFMNSEAFDKTCEVGKVVFFSRSKQRLWEKGESSGHSLEVRSISLDCDQDSILIQARANGPTCHTGEVSCFINSQAALDGAPLVYILSKLSGLIEDRMRNPQEGSYVNKLLSEPITRIAQKVGEEGLETALAAVAGDSTELTSEAADLLFHLLVLLQAKEVKLEQVLQVLVQRNS